jgi:hypothetical protein
VTFVVAASVVFDKLTGKSKGYGFVTFATSEGASMALMEPNKQIDGRMTEVRQAIMRFVIDTPAVMSSFASLVVCVCVYIYIYIYIIYIYVCMCVYVRYVRVCALACMRTCMHVRMHMRVVPLSSVLFGCCWQRRAVPSQTNHEHRFT